MYKKITNLEAVKQLIHDQVKLEEVAKVMYGLELRSAGSDNVKALCPFHKEDTPSFGINKTKQLYHCFACHAGGDLFKFVEEMDSVEFIVALRKLAEFGNIDIKPYQEAYTEAERKQQELYNINVDASEYALGQRSHATFQGWLAKRRLNPEVLETYGIGYSPAALQPENIPAADVEQAVALGLDRAAQWENVVVVPHRDSYGRINSFRNRMLEQSARAKVLGPDSKTTPFPIPWFYGIYEARRHIRENGTLILVEGEVDVWQMVAHGFSNTAATLGTRLNEEMLAELDRLSITRITLLADNDDAGRKFSRSVAQRLNTGRILIKIAILRSNGKDADEALLLDGDSSVRQALSEAKYAFEYLIDETCARFDVKRHSDKLEILTELAEYLKGATDLVRELAVRKLAATLGLDYEVVLDFYRESSSQSESPLYNVLAERVVLKGMVTDDSFCGDALLGLRADDFYLTKHRTIFEAVGKLYRKQAIVNADTVRTFVDNATGENNRALFDGIMHDNIDASGGKFMLDDLRDKSMRRSVQKLARESANKLGVVQLDARQIVQNLSAGVSRSIVGNGLNRVSESSQLVQERMNLMHSMIKNPNAIVGLDIGRDFPVLNSTLHGLQRGRYIVISAPSGTGKTAFMGCLAKRCAVELNEPSLVFTFETGKEAITDRLIANISGIESDKVITGFVTPAEVERIHDAAELISKAPLVITDRGSQYEECLAILRHDVLKRGTRIVFIDYIQLMSMAQADHRLRRDQELGNISRGFLDVAGELDITLVVIAQQNRDAVKGGSNEGTGIGESFKIYQDCDAFVAFRDKTKDELETDGPEKGNRKLRLSKHRHGKGGVELNVVADLDVMRIREYQPNRKPAY